jgi:hypothetical protein
MTLYKLVDPAHSHNGEIDTSRVNYGFGIEYNSPQNRELIKFFNAVINDSLREGIPFNVIFRETYQPKTTQQAVLFWETLYERTRKTDFPDKPSRLNSYFAFPTAADAERFRQRSHRSHKLRAFETHSCSVRHIGDMEHLDQVVPEMSAIEAAVKVRLYWQGTSSSSPLLECLVQGRLRLEDLG